nr:unnamed protein product [Callosobruchus analis]
MNGKGTRRRKTCQSEVKVAVIGAPGVGKSVSSVARNRNWCRDQDRENCTSELPVADLQHHPKTTPTEEEATVRRLYVRPPVEHLRII